MSSRVCFLCFQVADPTIQPETRKLRISTLCELLLSPTRRKVTPRFEEDESCEFCPLCAPVISKMEQIRYQMALLQEQIGQKIAKIRQMLVESPSLEMDDGGVKIRKLRTIILRITESEDNTDENGLQDDKVVLGDVQVKVEQDIDPLGSCDDQLFHDYNPFSPTADAELGNDEEEMDLVKNEVDDDPESAFCIVPDTQKRRKRRPRKFTRTKKPPPRIKRKREDDSPPPTEKQPRKPKLDSKIIKEENILPSSSSESRCSPRVKKVILSPLEDVKILKVSLERINLTKKSISKSESSSGDDTKSELGDNDWAPEIENTSSQTKVKMTKRSVRVCPYKCLSCARSFPSQIALSRHVGREHLLPCPVPTCSSSFRLQSAWDTHMKRDHPGVAPFQCTICKKKFIRENSLATHMVMCHENGEKKFPCVKCGKSFVLVVNLERHLKLHEIEGIKPLVCDLCDSRFADDERLQRHVETHNPKRFKCDQCGEPCRDRKLLERHMRLHTGERPEKCDQCEASFIDRHDLRRHTAVVHGSQTRDHVCHICGGGFRRAHDLTVHLRRHDESKRLVCEICGEKLLDASSLQSHLVKKHGADPFVCDECGAKFSDIKFLKRHKKVHTGEKPHKCDVCNAAFTWKHVLTAHMSKHTGVRPYPCPHCEQAFKQRKHRSTHIKRIHTPGYVPPIRYPCPHCPKGYESNHFLQAHMRQVHTGERPFICDQAGCDKAFAKKTSLYIHLKGHHGLVMEKKCKDRLPKMKKDEFPPEGGE